MEQKLQRNTRAGAMAGVCAGLAEYFNVDKGWVRLIFILSVVFSSLLNLGFLGPVAYIVLWIILPVKKDFIFQPAQAAPHDVIDRIQKRNKNDRKTAGSILLVVGFFFLLFQLNLFYWRDLAKFWPVIFIILGISMIFSSFSPRQKETGMFSDEAENQTADRPAENLDQ